MHRSPTQPTYSFLAVLLVLLVLASACGSYGHVHVGKIGFAEDGVPPVRIRDRGLQQGYAYVPEFNPHVQPHCNGLDNTTLPRCGTHRTAPFSRRAKVAIIGAGASGLTMAKLLRDRGYTNVHLLEKTGRAGGYSQTASFQDVPHEYATCYTTGRYECVLRLLDEAFVSPVPFPPTADEVLLGNTSLSLQQYWFFYATQQLVPPKSYAATPQGLAQFGQDVVLALAKYKELYFHYMGSGQYLFPSPQPSADKLQALNVTFGQYLQDNDLMILAPLLFITVTFQGYGHLASIPAFYALMWYSPNFVDSSIRDVQGLPKNRPGTSAAMLREGYGTFFQRIASKLPNIRLNVSISKVTRTPDNVRITWSSHPSAAGAKVVNKTEKFDFLVITSRMPASLSFLDARPDEVDVFGRLVHRYLDMAHVNVTGMSTRSPLIYQVTGAQSLQPNLITMLRNDVAMLNRYLMPTPDAADIRTVLTETTGATTEEQNKAAILAQLQGTWGAATAAFTRYGHYEYHSAFSAAEVTQGYPWKLRALQGKYRTWYAGSFASFESVADVLDYNYQLVNQELCV